MPATSTSSSLIPSEDTDGHLGRRPVILLLLDGWGIAPASEANALLTAKTPIFNSLVKEYPAITLGAGPLNWNVRYLSLGSGREISQEDEQISDTLTATVAAAGLKQVKITEAERFAALCHFFNGGREEKFAQEEWQIVSGGGRQHKMLNDSRSIIKTLLEILAQEQWPDLTVVSLPYLDLVASSAPADQVLIAQAAEQVDKYLKKVKAAVLSRPAWLVIAAAGGNAEQMIDMRTDQINNYLTANPLPLIVAGPGLAGQTIGGADAPDGDLSLLTPTGSLADVAPTILSLLQLDPPTGMSGRNLLDRV